MDEEPGPLWGEAKASQSKEPSSRASYLAENGLNLRDVCVYVCKREKDGREKENSVSVNNS